LSYNKRAREDALAHIEEAQDALHSAAVCLEGDDGECENCAGRDAAFERLRLELRFIGGQNDSQWERGANAIRAILDTLEELGMDDVSVLYSEAIRYKQLNPEY
jgi:hypothetical protein